jgi:hypothetical protein
MKSLKNEGGSKMKKLLLSVLIMVGLLCFVASDVLAAIGQSSEWEATGLNNGRRMVRE